MNPLEEKIYIFFLFIKYGTSIKKNHSHSTKISDSMLKKAPLTSVQYIIKHTGILSSLYLPFENLYTI